MSSKPGGWAAGLLALALAACGPTPDRVRPALWEVEGPQGQKAWLFGTIHALDRPADLGTPAFDQAFAASDRLVLEVAAIDDDARTGMIFTRLARTPGLPPLDQRVPADLAAPLGSLLASHKLDKAQFVDVETWAAALMVNQAVQARLGTDPGNGIDRQLLRLRGTKPLAELEGAEAQLKIFDGLAEADQRVLLADVVRSAGTAAADGEKMERAWKSGDEQALAAMTDDGMLEDSELREALLAGRNRAWATRLAPMIAAGEEPFVAVGSLHLVGPDGIPALLAARGFKVRRLQ